MASENVLDLNIVSVLDKFYIHIDKKNHGHVFLTSLESYSYQRRMDGVWNLCWKGHL
jgi:hypothetical protein